MLVMKNISYSYSPKKDRRLILDDVSCSFERGKVYAIYGSSGSGKTTCLSLLGGLEKPQKGTIELDGKDLKTIGYDNVRKRHVSYVFQDYHLFQYMTALENVELAMSISQKSGNRKSASQLLASLGIDSETMNRQVSKTSGGQQQRAAIARALVCDPGYILADEPTGNLDKDNTIRIMELLTDLAHTKNKCVIIATHADYVKGCADIQLELEHGKLNQVVDR